MTIKVKKTLQNNRSFIERLDVLHQMVVENNPRKINKAFLKAMVLVNSSFRHNMKLILCLNQINISKYDEKSKTTNLEMSHPYRENYKVNFNYTPDLTKKAVTTTFINKLSPYINDIYNIESTFDYIANCHTLIGEVEMVSLFPREQALIYYLIHSNNRTKQNKLIQDLVLTILKKSNCECEIIKEINPNHLLSYINEFLDKLALLKPLDEHVDWNLLNEIEPFIDWNKEKDE